MDLQDTLSPSLDAQEVHTCFRVEARCGWQVIFLIGDPFLHL